MELIMKLTHCLLLLCIVVPVFAGDNTNPGKGKITVTHEKNVLIKHYTNSEEFLFANHADRTINYPTQIVRISGTIKSKNSSCDDVFREIEQLYTDYLIQSELYYLNSYSYCKYDPKTEMATQFTISSYFDPVSDKAVDELTDWLEKMKGVEIYGVPLAIESAKELVVSLRVTSGYKEGIDDPDFLVYGSDSANIMFANNYQMNKELIEDINQRFYSYEPKIITSFFDKWFFTGAGRMFQKVLASSNYVLLEPDRIFIMDKEPQIFTPMLHIDYAHLCFDSKTKFCL
jgi:hypothetical protein